jgi:hypothetical protein
MFLSQQLLLQPLLTPESSKNWQHKRNTRVDILSTFGSVPTQLTCMHVPDSMPAAAAAARAVSSVREKGEL